MHPELCANCFLRQAFRSFVMIALDLNTYVSLFQERLKDSVDAFLSMSLLFILAAECSSLNAAPVLRCVYGSSR